jgi:hypothetical protein
VGPGIEGAGLTFQLDQTGGQVKTTNGTNARSHDMAENSRAGDSPVLHALCVTNELDVARATLSIAAAGLAPCGRQRS